MDQPPCPLWRPARRGIKALLAAGLLLLNGGCGGIRLRGTGLTPPMPVASPLRKQVLQGFMPFGSIGWVNDEQVVFHGVPVGANANSHSLFVWDQRGGPRKLLNRSHASCVSGGVIRAVQITEPGTFRTVSLRGPDFIPHPLQPDRSSGAGSSEPVTCSWIATPAPLRGRIWEPLRKGHGFLDFGPEARAPAIRRVEHLAADGSRRQDTGIRMDGPMLPRADYSAHDGSYLVYDLNVSSEALKRWTSGGRLRIWRLDSRNRGTAIDVPGGIWSDENVEFFSSRPGLLVRSNNFARNGDPVGAGLYLIRQGSQSLRLERGFVERLALSPDGCRLAYGFRSRLDTGIPEGGPRLVVIDLCGASANPP